MTTTNSSFEMVQQQIDCDNRLAAEAKQAGLETEFMALYVPLVKWRAQQTLAVKETSTSALRERDKTEQAARGVRPRSRRGRPRKTASGNGPVASVAPTKTLGPIAVLRDIQSGLIIKAELLKHWQERGARPNHVGRSLNSLVLKRHLSGEGTESSPFQLTQSGSDMLASV